ncbi:MAG: hypothetical protein ABWZ25_12600, partial [Chitinophagaceae bacterium]
MLKLFSINFLIYLVIPVIGLSQTFSAQLSPASFHHPSGDNISRQRCYLQLASVYIHVVREAQVDLDNSLIYASRSLGLSRLPILAEGINDPELLAGSQWVDQGDPAKGFRLLSKATGKKRLELLVLIGAYYAFQPFSYHRCRDTVEYFLTRAIKESRTANEDGLRRQAICLLGKMYLLGNNIAKGDSLFNELIRECQISGDLVTEARAWAYRGLYLIYSPATVADKITYFANAADVYRKLNDPEGEIPALMNNGYMHVTVFDLEKSNDLFLEALKA